MSDDTAAPTDASPIRRIRQGLLLFDPRNPRLVRLEDDGDLNQHECAERLLDGFDPLSIGRSMAAFGFFESDPLIAVREGDEFVVVEGNRRLLALRLLLDDELRRNLDAEPIWSVLATSMDDARRASLESVPTHVVPDRQAAAPVIGFRHIVGIRRWGAYEKVAFVRQLLLQHPTGEGFKRVSDLTGEAETRVRRYLRDFIVLQQAEDSGVPVGGAKEQFGVFTRLLNNAGVARFLELVPAGRVTPDQSHAYQADKSAVLELFGLLYGDDQAPPAFTDSRRISDFGRVIDNEEAREHLRRTRNLDESLGFTDGIRDRAISTLARIHTDLLRVGNDLSKIDHDVEIKAALKEVQDAADALSGPLHSGDDPTPEEGDYNLDDLDEDELDEDEFDDGNED